MSKYEEQRESARQAVLEMLSRVTGKSIEAIQAGLYELNETADDISDLERARLRAAAAMKLDLPDDIDEHCESCAEEACEDCGDECIYDEGVPDSMIEHMIKNKFEQAILATLGTVVDGNKSTAEVRDLVSAFAMYKEAARHG